MCLSVCLLVVQKLQNFTNLYKTLRNNKVCSPNLTYDVKTVKEASAVCRSFLDGVVIFLMTSHLNSHRTTDIKPEMLSGVLTGNGTPHDKYDIRGNDHARTNRKDEIFMKIFHFGENLTFPDN